MTLLADAVAFSGRDWLLVSVGLLFGLLALLAFPGEWRGRLWPNRPRAWWAWGRPLWRGWVRTGPISLVALPLMFIGVAIAAIAAALADPYESVLAFVAFVVVLAVVVCFLFAATIVFFNWPPFAVPPPFRAEQGAMQSWLRWGRRRLGRRKGF